MSEEEKIIVGDDNNNNVAENETLPAKDINESLSKNIMTLTDTVKAVMLELKEQKSINLKVGGQIGTLQKDYIKYRKGTSYKSDFNKEDSNENQENSESPEVKELLSKFNEIQTSLNLEKLENKKYRIQSGLKEKMVKNKIDQDHESLIKKILDTELSNGSLDEFSIDEFLLNLKETYPSLTKQVITPPIVGNTQPKDTDYEKMSLDQANKVFNKALKEL